MRRFYHILALCVISTSVSLVCEGGYVDMQHFLRLRPEILTYAAKVDPSRSSREAVCADLTHGGRCFRVIELPSNRHGRLLGLVGSVFYAEVGIDQFRSDTFFVTQIMAATKAPRAPVREYVAEVKLLGNGQVGLLDDVEPVFPAVAAKTTEPTHVKPSRAEVNVTASPRLGALLATAPDELRVRW